jgi:HTH-type transcriptional regulator/antitoxin MqsA
MTDHIHPDTGAPLHRDVRALTLTYEGQSITVDMPGWYPEKSDEGIVTGEDMETGPETCCRAAR